MADKHYLVLVIDEGDEPIIIAADIENGKITNYVSRGKYLAYIDKILPLSVRCALIPEQQARLRIGVFLPKFSQEFSADNTHYS